jgi:Zn-dependent peptidase ImmA (M78 family)
MVKRPMAEANRISTILRLYEPVADKRFPVDLQQLALDYSRQLSPDEPITDIKSMDIKGFEGMLVRHSSGKKWLIAYNDSVRSQGRIRFTLAHELGHYLLHRVARQEFECTLKDMYDWDSVERVIESEADLFASYLLMPLDDVREQINGQTISIDLLLHCAQRYGVSPMAAALKWLEIAPKRAMVVAARDGFVLWARANKAAYRSGVYLASRRDLIDVPQGSLLNSSSYSPGGYCATQRANLWFVRESTQTPLTELVYVSEGDYPYTLGLLLLPDAEPRWEQPDDELLRPLSGDIGFER